MKPAHLISAALVALLVVGLMPKRALAQTAGSATRYRVPRGFTWDKDVGGFSRPLTDGSKEFYV
jgi:hypothetical protein